MNQRLWIYFQHEASKLATHLTLVTIANTLLCHSVQSSKRLTMQRLHFGWMLIGWELVLNGKMHERSYRQKEKMQNNNKEQDAQE